MSEWGRTTYGEPCAECGFSWSTSQAEAIAIVAQVHERIAGLVEGREASTRHPGLAWSIGEYAMHVADNLRVYAERFVGVALSPGTPLAAYDQEELARVRGYGSFPLEAALWSLGRAAEGWVSAVGLIDDAEAIVEHPERGTQTVLDLVRSSAHDALHHAWDIRRSVEAWTAG